jgi:hypothetical protein
MQTLKSGIGVEGCFLAVTVNLDIYGRECREQSGLSANKFLKSQIRKFAELQNFTDLRTFRKCGNLRICDL